MIFKLRFSLKKIDFTQNKTKKWKALFLFVLSLFFKTNERSSYCFLQFCYAL